MKRALVAAGLTFLACLPIPIMLSKPYSHAVTELAPSPSTVGSDRNFATVPLPAQPSVVKLESLTLFDLPAQRKTTAPAPLFSLLEIVPAMRSIVVSGHVFDGRAWRVTLRDLDKGLWETLRPGESSQRLGVRLLEFRESGNQAPSAWLEQIHTGERWAAAERQSLSGKLLARIRLPGGGELVLPEGQPVEDSGWVLTAIAEDTATFTLHGTGEFNVVLPRQNGTGSAP